VNHTTLAEFYNHDGGEGLKTTLRLPKVSLKDRIRPKVVYYN
jgi:hypothetical protein